MYGRRKTKSEDDKSNKLEQFFNLYKLKLSGVSDKIYSTLAQHSNGFIEAGKINKNHRKRTFQYMKIASVLLFKSVAMDITYELLKDGKFEDGMETPEVDEILMRNYELWKPRFASLSATINEVDRYLTNIWSTQYIRDIDEITSEEHWRSETYAAELHSLLQEKYFWRRWFVVVIPDWNDTGNKFDVNTCGGYVELHSQEKHFFVKSVEAEESSFRRMNARLRLRNLKANPLSLFGALRAKATLLNEEMNLDCRQFDMFGSVRIDDDVAIYGNYDSMVTNVYETFFTSTYRSFIML